MNNLILIPARKGSKGLRNKNIKNYNGKPLIEHTLNECQKLKFKNTEILVSTDCKVTQRISKKYGYHHNYRRPKNISKDKTNIIDTVIHCVEWFKEKKSLEIKNVILLQPTSPLRTAQEIIRSIKIYRRLGLESLASVTLAIQDPNEIVTIKSNKMKPLIKNNSSFQRQNYKDKYFFIDGSIYISSIKSLKKNKSFFHKSTFPFYLNKKYSIDINDIDDFNAAIKLSK